MIHDDAVAREIEVIIGLRSVDMGGERPGARARHQDYFFNSCLRMLYKRCVRV